jgi:ectoine hydroxylase-related dioxygenase (phytanoyl-CoA dioxygenase family)
VIGTTTNLDELERVGFTVVPSVASESVVRGLVALMESLGAECGRRNVLADFEEVRATVRCESVRSLVEAVLGPNAFAAHGLFFDKTPAANWMVGWHQDRTIAVRERRETSGFTLWTVKAGVPHVQPPVRVLEQMVILRLHLDDADESNGALRVVPGSHQVGLIHEDQIDSWVQRHPPVTCLVPRRGAVLMRPLLLHASSKATRPAHRRVLHLEFAAASLPGGLNWAFSA